VELSVIVDGERERRREGGEDFTVGGIQIEKYTETVP